MATKDEIVQAMREVLGDFVPRMSSIAKSLEQWRSGTDSIRLQQSSYTQSFEIDIEAIAAVKYFDLKTTRPPGTGYNRVLISVESNKPLGTSPGAGTSSVVVIAGLLQNNPATGGNSGSLRTGQNVRVIPTAVETTTVAGTLGHIQGNQTVIEIPDGDIELTLETIFDATQLLVVPVKMATIITVTFWRQY